MRAVAQGAARYDSILRGAAQSIHFVSRTLVSASPTGARKNKSPYGPNEYADWNWRPGEISRRHSIASRVPSLESRRNLTFA